MALNGQMLTEVDAQSHQTSTVIPEFVDNHAFESLQDIKFAIVQSLSSNYLIQKIQWYTN